jgi:hypothetical protein
VLFVHFQDTGHDAPLFACSQHLSSGLDGCFLLQCLQIGALQNLLRLSLCFFLFSLLSELGVFACVLPFTRLSISFLASVVDLIRVSIWRVCASVSWAMSSSVASACFSTAFAPNCFPVSLFCFFAFKYSVEMKVLMFAHVYWAVGLVSHSLTAASNSPELFKKYNAMLVCSFRYDWIPALSCFIAFYT